MSVNAIAAVRSQDTAQPKNQIHPWDKTSRPTSTVTGGILGLGLSLGAVGFYLNSRPPGPAGAAALIAGAVVLGPALGAAVGSSVDTRRPIFGGVALLGGITGALTGIVTCKSLLGGKNQSSNLLGVGAVLALTVGGALLGSMSHGIANYPGSPGGHTVDEIATKLIENFDRRPNDGELEKSEWKIKGIMIAQARPSDASKLMKRAEVSGDDVVDRSELIAALADADKTGEGRLNTEEYSSLGLKGPATEF